MRPYPCEAESAGPGGPRQRARAVVTASLQPADLFGTKREPPAKHFGARYGRVGPRASLPQSGGRIIVRGRPCPAFFVQLPGRSRGAESVAQYVRSSARLPSWNERMRPPDRKKAGGGAPCVAREHRPSQGRCHARSVPRGSRWGQVWSGTDAEPAPAVQVSRSGYGCGVLPCGKGFTPRWAGAYPSPRPGPR